MVVYWLVAIQLTSTSYTTSHMSSLVKIYGFVAEVRGRTYEATTPSDAYYSFARYIYINEEYYGSKKVKEHRRVPK
jgi:hypothetical protein